MLTLYFVSVVESRTLVEISIDLLNLWYLPAIVLLRLRESIVLRLCMHFCLPSARELVGSVVDLLPQPFFLCLIEIPTFKAIKFFPSFGLSCGQDCVFMLGENRWGAAIANQFI